MRTKLFVFLTLLLIAVLAAYRLDLGIHRYFDPDELMYLNWAYHVSAGAAPYRDFMMFVTPLYVYALSTLFFLFRGVDPVAAARILSWVISLALAASAGAAFWSIHKSRMGLVASSLVLFLPMPSDKLMEIRPDSLSLVFFTGGLALFAVSPFLTGLLFGLSLLILQKTAILIAVATAVLMLTKKTNTHFFLGLTLPIAAFLLWALATGDPQTVLYSVTILAKEHVLQVARFNVLPIFFYFSPNSTYYGSFTLWPGLIVNHLLWVMALVFALARTLECCVKRNRRALLATLPALLFFASLIQYIWISPLKFPQYLLPAGVFASWLVADGAGIIFRGKKISLVLAPASLIFLLWVFLAVNTPKRAWTNDFTYHKIKRILARIPTNQYVFDLEGRTIYYPYPYYACCLALGQFDSILFRRYPAIRDALSQTKTKYIYQAEIPRIGALSAEDQAFIYQNYRPDENGDLYVSKYW